MSGKPSKAFKWCVYALRVAKVRFVVGSRLKIASGKPLYLGKNTRLILGEGASLVVGSGVYLSPGSVLQVDNDATLVMEDGVLMNEGCRVTVVEPLRVGDGTLFGLNVQVCDRDSILIGRGSARSCFTRRPPSGGFAGFVPTWSSRVAARLRIARLSQRTPFSRATFPKRACCTLAPLHG